MAMELKNELACLLNQAAQMVSDYGSADPYLDRAYDLIDAAIDEVNAMDDG